MDSTASFRNVGDSDRSALRAAWRMPPLWTLEPTVLTPLSRFWLVVLRGYLLLAVTLAIVRVTQIALGKG